MLHNLGEIRYKKSAHNVFEYLSVSKKSAQGSSTYLTSLIETFLGTTFWKYRPQSCFSAYYFTQYPNHSLVFKNLDATQNLHPRRMNYYYLKLSSSYHYFDWFYLLSWLILFMCLFQWTPLTSGNHYIYHILF